MALARKAVLWIALFVLFVAQSSALTETQWRDRLGIPKNASRVLILSQSSHMDWDWNETFLGYYNSRVDDILTSATSVLSKYSGEKQPYYYSVAETGFLQHFWQQHPDSLVKLRQSGHTLHLVGGGITSPDSLLNHGEAFIRNFLVGQAALRNVSLPVMTNIWVPDDFGHDSQLPVMVRAMGLGAAGFARVPGAVDQGPAAKRLDGMPSVADILMKEGVSFTWQARDGSTLFAHWLQDHYNQGDSIDKPLGPDLSCQDYTSSVYAALIAANIQRFIGALGPTAVSPYMFLPIGDDFTSPKPCLLTYASIWNKHYYGSSASYGDVYVVSATFDHYVGLVSAFAQEKSRPLTKRAFHPTPYWTGFYASRPLLKSLQEASVRMALAGEALSIITRTQANAMTQLQQAWQKIAPSTHHDFVTGTSPDDTYQNEQIPYLTDALAITTAVANQGLKSLALNVTTDAGEGERGIALFNPLGATRKGWSPVFIPPELDLPNSRSFFDGSTYQPIQKLPNGGHVTKVNHDVQPLSVSVGKLSTKISQVQSNLRIYVDNGSGKVLLENSHIRVAIAESAHWAAVSVFDLETAQELVSPTDRDAGAFALQILQDNGNIYRFANEMEGCQPNEVSYKPISAKIDWNAVLDGSVMLRVPTLVQYEVNGQVYTFNRTYELFAEDKMIRVEFSGKAPPFTSVFARTPITFLQPWVSYGTPYHWDDVMPHRYWPGYNFFVAHNFVTLTSLEGLRLAFYSSVLRAWALDDRTVVTALFRNTPGGMCRGYGADGSDSDSHVVTLALRTPSGLGAPDSLSPLMESLAYSTPLMTTHAKRTGTNSPTKSLMRILNADGSSEPVNAIITSIKPSDKNNTQIVVRIYSASAQRDNPVHLRLDSGMIRLAPQKSVLPITALENPLPRGDDSIVVHSIRGNGATLTIRAAVTSLLLVPS